MDDVYTERLELEIDRLDKIIEDQQIIIKCQQDDIDMIKKANSKEPEVKRIDNTSYYKALKHQKFVEGLKNQWEVEWQKKK